MTAHRLRDLPLGDPAWAQAFPVLTELRPQLDRATFDAILAAGARQGLTYTGAFDASGTCLGLAGWRVMDTPHVVRKLYVDDLVTTAGARSRGIGASLLAHLEQRGREAGCRVLDLDSGHQRRNAHRFYLREGFEDVSRHFAKPLERD